MKRARKKPACPPPKRPRLVYQIAEVAEKLGLSPQRVLHLIEEGKLGAINVGCNYPFGQRYYRIPVAWLEAYQHEHAKGDR